MKTSLTWLALAALLPAPAYAGEKPFELPENLSDCEVLMMRFVEDEGGNGGMDISTYGPAEEFIASVYDDEDGHLTKMRNDPIRALMCQRNDVLPIEADYPLLATGIPFILSQDFDDTETDSLTMYWRKGYFDYVYKGYPLSEETQAMLEARLGDFTTRDHGLPGSNINVKGPQVVSTASDNESEDDKADKAETYEMEDK